VKEGASVATSIEETGNQSRKRTYHRQGDAGGVTSNCNQVFQTPGRQPDRWEQERRTQLRQGPRKMKVNFMASHLGSDLRSM